MEFFSGFWGFLNEAVRGRIRALPPARHLRQSEAQVSMYRVDVVQ